MVCTFDQIAWFIFRDDEMVCILGTLATGIREANTFLPGKYDVIIDYFFCYTRVGFCGDGDEHGAL